jgi:hypothetical protein
MKTMGSYQKKLRAILSPAERRVLQKLSTPQKIQDFLDSFPINVLGGEHTMRSPREVLKIKKAHCMEGALLAAASLAYHGEPPLLMDLRSVAHDLDHVVALFKENNLWGSISKTNHPVLRYRDPIYRSVRELAMSYFHEYFIGGQKNKKNKRRGEKTLRAYSKPFDLRRYAPEKWVIVKGNLDWLAEALDDSAHFPIAPATAIKKLRKASDFEIRATDAVEWPKKKN